MRWCRLTEETQNTPNAANCGSFFHFPKEAGGLIHVTLVWRSRSPMERSTTYQRNKTPAVHLLLLTPDGKQVCSYLFFFTTLLEDELIKDGSKLLVDLLHLVDVAGNFVHRFHGNCGQTAQFLQWDVTGLTMFQPCPTLEPAPTIQVVMLLTVWVCEWVKLLKQEGVLQYPLDGFDQVGLQRGRVLLFGVALI